MQKESVIIIGAGLSGLSAGTFAQRAGYNSTIFEHHYHSGGLASFWKRDKFLIDGGIHYFSGYREGLKSYAFLKELGISDPNLYVPMKEYLTYIDEPSGVKVTIKQDMDELREYLKRMAPKDSKIIDEIFNAVKLLKGSDYNCLGLSELPELSGVLGNLKLMWEARSLFRFMGRKYSQPVNKFIGNVHTHWLKSMFNNLFSPSVPMSFVLMLLSSFSDNQIAYIKDGSRSFISAIEKNYKSLGGNIKFKSTVTKILTEDGKACGIQLKDGQKIMGDYIISAGDAENAIYNLLEGKYLNPTIDHIYKKGKPCKPLLMSTYAINQDLKDEPVFTQMTLKEPIKYGDTESSGLFFRIMNYGNFAPKGKTILQATIETEWDYWNNLVKEKSKYKEEKKRISNEILKRLDEYYPKIAERVELVDIATPTTFNRFTLNKNGSWGGWEMSPELFSKKKYKTLPKLKNFYMAGHWVLSCGVLPSLYSGKHAIDLIQHDRKL